MLCKETVFELRLSNHDGPSVTYKLTYTYLTDVLGVVPAVGQLGRVRCADVLTLLQVEGLVVLQLITPQQKNKETS